MDVEQAARTGNYSSSQYSKTPTRLDGDPSTHHIVIDGHELRRADGREPLFNFDGLALITSERTSFSKHSPAMRSVSLAVLLLQAIPAPSSKVEKVATDKPADWFMDGRGELRPFNVVSAGACNQPLTTSFRTPIYAGWRRFRRAQTPCLVMIHIWSL